MKSAAAAQVAIVLLLLASAASCAVAKEYSTRVFKPSVAQKKSDSIALKFMEFDSGNASDSVDLKEFFAKEASQADEQEVKKDTTKAAPAIIEEKVVVKEPSVDATKRGTTRSKRVRQ
jgi:hypothetical protein